MTSKDRRRFLRSATASAALSLFPPAIRRALAIPASNTTGTIRDVQHVVIFMQENRSFDHYLGTLPGVRGFGDRITIPQPQGESVWQQSDGTRSVLPFHLDKSQGNALLAGGAHEWVDAHGAWDNGRMTQWPKSKGDISMGYLREADLPFHFALANAFTVCDAYHCSLMGGTNSNRLFLLTGTNGPGNSDSNGVSRHAVVNNNGWDWLGPSANGLTWTTYVERLQKAGVSWKIYENQPDNYNDNPLAGFAAFRKIHEAIAGSPNLAWSAALESREPLYKGIGNTMPDGGFLQAFKDDIAANQLPQVSWIVSPQAYCEHPAVSTPGQGAWYMQQLLDALTANPEVWSQTVLFVNYDENDCFFDHMPPPAAPSPIGNGAYAGKSTVSTKHEYFTVPNPPGDSTPLVPDGQPYGAGPRVPMFVVSPWSTGGLVNSQVFDHTSVLRFLELRFGVEEPNISAWRRAVFGDLTSTLNFSTPNKKPVTSFPAPSKASADAQKAQQHALKAVAPPALAEQAMPVQVRFARPSRALPYRLHADATIVAKRSEMRLALRNEGSAGVVFHVYDTLHLERAPRRYTVEAGKHLDDTWTPAATDAGAYDLWVLGPNGFHRRFTGNASAAARGPATEMRLRYDEAANTLVLTLANSGPAQAECTVTANAYRSDGPWTLSVPAHGRAEQRWLLDASGGWYDFTLSAVKNTDGANEITRRFAGRMETGKDSISDPEMGIAR
ncbi:Non-hemolytic phospholipase C [Paraburkholderia caffeinitolerans]|uniref:phospholipase C n=1 Tax=Paraburkholderia caffeinitolerans TaxID=1723730 RepID=A0A6J5FRB8_9BURK|nr:phospholipase C, phosphocholine-specific [Paraburkholderia caffeinitolerans]CAB3783824.1 Non-hemolytic phospholipase C [Paraburkholderia caffeinitolerans]